MHADDDSRIQLNGRPADVADLRTPALLNYGHFTSMQVSRGRVRGLDLHLERLRHATLELFGTALDLDATRGWMRQVAGTSGTCTLRVNVFSRALHRDRLAMPAAPDVLVSAVPARALVPTPLRVRSAHYRREAPHIKHVGTFGLFHQKRLAQAAGFDDALFVDADGAVCEGSIWNIGFFDGERIVWPDAPMLQGVSMQLLQAGLRRLGVPTLTRRIGLADVAGFRSAFFTNTACAVMPIAGIDDVGFIVDPLLQERLEESFALNPWQPI